MALVDYMPFVAAEVPSSKQFVIDGQQYTYRIEYNETFDFYSMIVSDAAGEVLYTTRIVYDLDLLHAIVTLGIERLIKAFDFTSENTAVDSSNFGDPVKVYVLENN